MQEEIHEAAYRYQMEIESGTRSVVGVNAHVDDEGSPRIGQPDYSALEASQVGRLKEWKDSRDGEAANSALARVRSVAATTENLLLPLIDAVKRGVTLGEVSDALRDEWARTTGRRQPRSSLLSGAFPDQLRGYSFSCAPPVCHDADVRIRVS